MKTYREEMICNTSPQTAWKALQEMNVWLPQLSTNKEVKYQEDGGFFYQGRKYTVVTKEGISMDSEIYKVDESKRCIEIHASHAPLKSVLTCSVEAIDDTHCKLVRTQAYPGWFGFLFTRFFNKRESGETSEYLQVWARHAGQISG